MKNIKHYLFAAVASGVLIFASCQKEKLSPTPSSSTDDSTFAKASTSTNYNAVSGEELFKGIFFGQGQVTQAIPELANVFNQAGQMSAEEQSEFNAIMNETVAMIQNEKPQFFGNFKSGIQSGDHFEIDATMQDAAKVLAKSVCRVQQYVDPNTEYDEALSNSIKNETGLSAGETVSGDISYAITNEASLTNDLSQMSELELAGGNGGAQLSPVWIILVAVVAVAAIEVAVVVDMAWWFSSVAAPSEDSVLKKEMIINSIATNLKYVN